LQEQVQKQTEQVEQLARQVQSVPLVNRFTGVTGVLDYPWNLNR